jgi:hypothetical protein
VSRNNSASAVTLGEDWPTVLPDPSRLDAGDAPKRSHYPEGSAEREAAQINLRNIRWALAPRDF